MTILDRFLFMNTLYVSKISNLKNDVQLSLKNKSLGELSLMCREIQNVGPEMEKARSLESLVHWVPGNEKVRVVAVGRRAQTVG